MWSKEREQWKVCPSAYSGGGNGRHLGVNTLSGGRQPGLEDMADCWLSFGVCHIKYSKLSKDLCSYESIVTSLLTN